MFKEKLFRNFTNYYLIILLNLSTNVILMSDNIKLIRKCMNSAKKL